MTLALLHEFYLGTCKIKARKSVLRSLLCKSALFSVILLVLMLLERIPLAFFDPKLDNLKGKLVNTVSPAVIVALTIMTTTSVYFGVRILLSLARSQRMSGDSNQSVRKYVTLYRVVVVAIVFSAIKLLMLLIRVAMRAFINTSIESCLDTAALGAETLSCYDSLAQFSLSIHVCRDTLVGLIELIFINGIMILKNRKNVDG